MAKRLNIIAISEVADGAAAGSEAIGALKAGIVAAYRKSFKRVPLVRWAVIRAWRTLFPLYTRLVRRNDRDARRWRRLVRLSRFGETSGSVRVSLADAAEINNRPPMVYPGEWQHYIMGQASFSAPPICVWFLQGAQVNGGSNLVQVDNTIVCHDLFEVERDYTSEELHGRAFMSVRSSQIRWLLTDPSPAQVPLAATFVDACAPNYAHWLTEVLPRIALYCSDERFRDVPIVVNSGLHPNILDSLSLFAGETREVITLPIGRSLKADVLHQVSVAGYVPFERRRECRSLQSHCQGSFNPGAFEELRRAALLEAASAEDAHSPRKIFVRRNSGGRRIVNASELERALLARGFEIVEPEKLTFLEQVRLFSQAETIVGSSGAAMANVIFAKESARICILIGRYQETSYWYWQNIASAAGTSVSYVFGEIQGSGVDPIHSDFFVDCKTLVEAVGEGESESAVV